MSCAKGFLSYFLQPVIYLGIYIHKNTWNFYRNINIQYNFTTQFTQFEKFGVINKMLHPDGE